VATRERLEEAVPAAAERDAASDLDRALFNEDYES
jgi:hypothetical protein